MEWSVWVLVQNRHRALCRPMFRRTNGFIRLHCFTTFATTTARLPSKHPWSGGGSDISVVHRRCRRRHTRSHPQIDAYPTVNVYCTTCNVQLFRYKKKNGTKSNLVKCYIERIVEDCVHLLRDQYYHRNDNNSMRDDITHSHHRNSSEKINTSNSHSSADLHPPQIQLPHPIHNNNNNNIDHAEYYCPKCRTKIARYARIHNVPSMKWLGGKIRMSKK